MWFGRLGRSSYERYVRDCTTSSRQLWSAYSSASMMVMTLVQIDYRRTGRRGACKRGYLERHHTTADARPPAKRRPRARSSYRRERGAPDRPGRHPDSAKSAINASISAGSKPVIERSRFISGKRFANSPSSLARAARSHPAFTAILLSAIARARLSSSDRSETTRTGISASPGSMAARYRPCPAMILSFSSTTTGDVNPKRETL